MSWIYNDNTATFIKKVWLNVVIPRQTTETLNVGK